MTHQRPYDLVLFGATGFAGRLTALALAKRLQGSPLRWALAGRTLDKLEAVRREVAELDPTRADLPLLVARSDDLKSLADLAASTRVVLTTVGPYALHGEPLVAACVHAGTDYADLTGEPSFVRRMLTQYDAAARTASVRIVNCCGFDSIPHDMGVLYTVRELRQGRPLAEAVSVEGIVDAAGTISGGTWQSAIGAIAQLGRIAPAPRQETAPGRQVGRLKRGVHRDGEGGWLVPLPTIDPEVVLRSARTLAEYGPAFRYGHYVRVRKTASLVGGALALGGIVALAQLSPTRALLMRAKGSGEGPSPEQRAKAWFRVTFHARTASSKLTTRVSGGDPGYDETAKMLAETGICLVEDRDNLPLNCGVVTPAAGLGHALLNRLERHVLKFEVLSRD